MAEPRVRHLHKSFSSLVHAVLRTYTAVEKSLSSEKISGNITRNKISYPGHGEGGHGGGDRDIRAAVRGLELTEGCLACFGAKLVVVSEFWRLGLSLLGCSVSMIT